MFSRWLKFKAHCKISLNGDWHLDDSPGNKREREGGSEKWFESLLSSRLRSVFATRNKQFHEWIRLCILMLYFVEGTFYISTGTIVNHSVSSRIFHVRCLTSQMVIRVPLNSHTCRQESIKIFLLEIYIFLIIKLFQLLISIF